jgi:hypothetical protein
VFRRVIKEPLVHFAALALIIFAVYFALAPDSDLPAVGKITVTQAKIEQMAVIYTKIWQRPPDPSELKGLIDDYVKEEIYVREALALGLDKDDTVIRSRLRQKMEFMSDSVADQIVPTDADLEAYLKAHPELFAIDPMTGFQQIYLNPDKHGNHIGPDAQAILATLQGNPAADLATLGDASLLPSDMPASTSTGIAQTFGADFAAVVAKAEQGKWFGPVASGFGQHLVRVTERKPGRLPALAEVRDAVLREWSNQRRTDLAAAQVNGLLKRYQVTIETVPAAGVTP